MRRLLLLFSLSLCVLTTACEHHKPLKNANDINLANKRVSEWIEKLGERIPDKNELPEGFYLRSVPAQYATVATIPMQNPKSQKNSMISEPHQTLKHREIVKPSMVYLVSDTGSIVKSWPNNKE